MSTPITYGLEAIPATPVKPAGWLARAFDRLVAAREQQAKAYIVNYLGSLSDSRLTELGYTAKQIHEIRVERELPVLAN